MILLLKSDTSSLELVLIKSNEEKVQESHECGRSMAKDIPKIIEAFLTQHSTDIQHLQGIGVYAGPGSFTGLRITHTYANSLAYALEIPIVSSQGELWELKAVQRLRNSENDHVVVPDYGKDAHITQQKK